MAHFALIDDNNVVQDVQVINNDAFQSGIFPESEPLGQAFQASLGITGTWLQCSYSGSFRGVYPAKGWIYDPALDQFIEPSDIEETP